jgi:hypothetical protein
MANGTVHLALFNEDQINETAEAIAKLHSLGIGNEEISVISGVPISDRVLGRPMSWTRVPVIAGAGAVVGFIAAAILVFGTQIFYPIQAGAMPNAPIPTSIVVLFELTMLGLLVSTLLGVVIEMISPSFGPAGYDISITDGKIGILFTSPTDKDGEIHEQFEKFGAQIIHRAEVKKLWP